MKDPIHELRAELMAVEPSPAFAPGVRQRIAVQSGVDLRLQFALALATVAVAVVAGGAYWLRLERPDAAPAAAAPVAQSIAPQVEPSSRVTAVPTVRPTRRAPAPAEAAEASAAALTDSGPSLEILTNQPAIIRRLRSAVLASTEVKVSEPADVIEIPEIVVAPIVVNEVSVPSVGEIRPGRRGASNASRGDAVRSTR